MFLFNTTKMWHYVKELSIQIHLMFLFNVGGGVSVGGEHLFKYISCSYLTERILGTIFGHTIQIHLMFLFNLATVKTKDYTIQFKYISCSYLTPTVFTHLQFLLYFQSSHFTRLSSIFTSQKLFSSFSLFSPLLR